MKLNKNNYRETLKAFNLPSFWEEQLLNTKMKDKGLALRILDEMSDDASSIAISNKAGSHNNHLRKHAKSIFMKFDSNDAFKFLEDDFDQDFNSLDEVRIHDALKEKSKIMPLPQLIRWVNTAKNDYFKTFLIREIGLFKQIESAEQLITIYKESDSNMIKAQTAMTLGMLDYKKAIPILVNNFDYNKQEVQDAVIYAMGKFGGYDALDFLEKIYHQTHNKETLINIIQNIYQIDKTRMVFTKLKNNNTTSFEKSIFDYIEQGHAIR